jgi:hypothetical protein
MPGEAIPVSFPGAVLAILAVITIIALLVHVVSDWRAAARGLLALAVVAGVGVILLQVVASLSGPGAPPTVEPGNGSVFGGGGGGGSDSADVSSPSPGPVIILLVVGLGLAVAVVGARVRPTATRRNAPETDTANETGPAAVRNAAGRAANRLTGDANDAGTTAREHDHENDVYRAWHELTTSLSVPEPQTTTPGEFADAAVAAGLDRDDVEELTRLFEAARYDEGAPAEAEERRAVTIFRRLEAQLSEPNS